MSSGLSSRADIELYFASHASLYVYVWMTVCVCLYVDMYVWCEMHAGLHASQQVLFYHHLSMYVSVFLSTENYLSKLM